LFEEKAAAETDAQLLEAEAEEPANNEEEDEEKEKEKANAAEEDNEAEDENEDEAADEAEDEKAEEVIFEEPKQNPLKFIVSFDTLGTAHLYSAAKLDWIDRSITKLERVLETIDISEFQKQREFEKKFSELLNEYQSTILSENEAKIAEIDKQNEEKEEAETDAEAILNSKKHSLVFHSIHDMLKLMCEHVMKPTAVTCKTFVALLNLCCNEFRCEYQPSMGVITSAQWKGCLQFLSTLSDEKLETFDASSVTRDNVSIIEQWLSTVNVEELSSEGIGILTSIVYRFVHSSCELSKFVEQQKIEEEARKAAEEAAKADEAEAPIEDADDS
jgi:hypothetical protein